VATAAVVTVSCLALLVSCRAGTLDPERLKPERD